MILPSLALLLAGQTPVTACPVVPPPPTGLAGWVASDSRPGIGKRFTITGAAHVAGLTAEERARGGTAAILELRIDHPGSYAIALSDVAWVEVAQHGKTLVSTGHDHGPACTGIRKIVRFTLGSGAVQLRLSGIKSTTLGVLIAQQ